jgi:hypothetical protein
LARDVLFDESQEELAKLEAAGEEFEEVKPLAEELIDTLIDLLFFADFTLPRRQNSKNKVTYAIWQSGVGCNTAVGTSKEFESNRTEILRLLLTLTSQSMYLTPGPRCEGYQLYRHMPRQAGGPVSALFFTEYCKSSFVLESSCCC